MIYNMVMLKIKISMDNIAMLYISVIISSILNGMLSNSCFNFGCGSANMVYIAPYNINNNKYTYTIIN
jgi:hypothetical protein